MNREAWRWLVWQEQGLEQMFQISPKSNNKSKN